MVVPSGAAGPSPQLTTVGGGGGLLICGSMEGGGPAGPLLPAVDTDGPPLEAAGPLELLVDVGAEAAAGLEGADAAVVLFTPIRVSRALSNCSKAAWPKVLNSMSRNLFAWNFCVGAPSVLESSSTAESTTSVVSCILVALC